MSKEDGEFDINPEDLVPEGYWDKLSEHIKLWPKLPDDEYILPDPDPLV